MRTGGVEWKREAKGEGSCRMSARGDRFVFRALRDENGNADMNVDGSVTPRIFNYVAPPESVEVCRVLIIVANVDLGSNEFGGLGHALANGIDITLHDKTGELLTDFTDGLRIKRNDDWDVLCGVAIPIKAKMMDSMPIRWTLTKAGVPMQMDCGDEIRITVRDDLTGLKMFRAMVQGLAVKHN